MTRRRGARRRGGWRKVGRRWQVYVRVHGGKGGFRSSLLPLTKTVEERQTWIDDQVTDYRRDHPRVARGTLAHDVQTYLKVLVNRPALQRDRKFQLAWWCERFGDRPRGTLQAHELETALNELAAGGAAASTVKKYRTALYHLITKLDGRNAANPLRDVTPPREPDPLPRAIPYDIIDAIFEHMPDRRYARKIDDTRAALVYAEATAPGANRTAIAKAHGLSEAMVRKIVERRGRRSDHASQTKARLQLMAYVGLPPAQIRALRPEDVDLEDGTLLAHGRKKGGGTRPTRLKLTPAGLQAARTFVSAEAFERDQPDGTRTAFSASSALKTWRRAIAALCRALAKKPDTQAVAEALRRELAARTPYDLRHSFLTELQLATGNISATQSHALHTDSRMTRRYTLAAVTPELERAAELLAQRRAGQERRPVATNMQPMTTTNPVKPQETGVIAKLTIRR